MIRIQKLSLFVWVKPPIFHALFCSTRCAFLWLPYFSNSRKNYINRYSCDLHVFITSTNNKCKVTHVSPTYVAKIFNLLIIQNEVCCKRRGLSWFSLYLSPLKLITSLSIFTFDIQQAEESTLTNHKSFMQTFAGW